MTPLPHHHQTQLITYADSLGTDLAGLATLLEGPLDGVFPGGVHLLPPFVSSGDRGFAPLSYEHLEPALGDWPDLVRISSELGLTLDIMVNHISRVRAVQGLSDPRPSIRVC